MDALMTVDEVAERLHRPVATVRYWRATQQGPKNALVAGRVMYRASDVENWIAEQFSKSSESLTA